jgi:hypothetical protein
VTSLDVVVLRIDGNSADHAIEFSNRRQSVAKLSAVGRERLFGVFNARLLNQGLDEIDSLIGCVAAIRSDCGTGSAGGDVEAR